MKKSAAIMQPTYLPWLGYFDLMDQVDTFILLDTVQFEKRSWQQRNKIKTATGELVLTVPVFTKGKFTQKINQVKINNTTFYKTHLKSLANNYNKAKYYQKYYFDLVKILSKNHTLLVDLNIEIILWLKKILKIKSQIIRSSFLDTCGKKADLLVNICDTLGIQHYISPNGSRVYLKKSKSFTKKGIGLTYHNYQHPTYKQLYGKFISHLSVVDLLFNEGPKSLSIIKSGRI